MMKSENKMEKKYCWDLVLIAMRENRALLSTDHPEANPDENVVAAESKHFSSYESANPSLCFFETSQELDVDDYCHRFLETIWKALINLQFFLDNFV